MAKHFLFSSLLVMFIYSASAQNNFVDGNVVTLNGDTLKGQINDLLWQVTPTQIEFRDARTTSKYDPKDIKGFSVNNQTFRSFEVKYDSSSNHVGKLSGNQSPDYKKAHLFLRLIAESNYALLEFIDHEDRDHFFIQDDVKVTELINHRFSREGSADMLTSKVYIGQLRAYFADCKSMVISDNIAYNKKTITNLVEQYGSCKGFVNRNVSSTKPKYRVDGGITANLCFDKFQGDFDWGLGYGIGGFFNIILPHKLYKTKLRIELAYHKFPSQDFTYLVSGQTFYETVSTSSITSAFGVQSRFDNSKRQSFVSLGGRFSPIKSKSEGTYWNGVQNDSYSPRIGLYCGIGTYFGPFSPEFRFEYGAAGYMSAQLVASFSFASRNWATR